MSITKSILLIIDLQKGFVNANTEYVIDAIISAKRNLDYDFCVFTKFNNSDETAFSRFLNWNKLQTAEEQRIAIPVSEKDVIIEKHTYSAVVDELMRIITAQNIENVFLCGIDTDGCVLATAFALFDSGIKPQIIIDACASGGGAILHQAAEMIMQRSFGKDQVNNLIHYLGG